MAGQGSFGHLMGGYDAGYYGYMYSLVFAADMYATVFKKNPLDPKLGGFLFHFVFSLLSFATPNICVELNLNICILRKIVPGQDPTPRRKQRRDCLSQGMNPPPTNVPHILTHTPHLIGFLGT